MGNKLTYDLHHDLQMSRWFILFIMVVSVVISSMGLFFGESLVEQLWSPEVLSYLIAALCMYGFYLRMMMVKRYPTIYAALSFLCFGVATYLSNPDDVKGIWFMAGSISYILIYGVLIKLFDIDNPEESLEYERTSTFSLLRELVKKPDTAGTEMANERVIKIEMSEMQEWSVRLMVFLLLTGLLPFLIIWGYSDSFAVLGDIHESFLLWLGTFLLYVILFILMLAVGSLVHELIHALFFLPFLQSGLNALKFGYLKEKLALYVHLEEPISVTGFRIGTVMPAIILGVLPIAFGLLFGYLSATLFGIIMLTAAVGDFLLLVKTMHLHSGYMIIDQPDDIAIIAVENNRPGELVS